MSVETTIKIARIFSIGAAVAALMLALVIGTRAHAAAGTNIVNTAQASFAMQETASAATSNSTTTQVGELLDLTLVPKISGTISIPGDGLSAFAVPFTLSNTGNGQEAFHVEALLAQGGVLSVAIDVDGNATYDPAFDIALAADGTTPILAPGADIALLVRFVDQPAASGTITITARAVTGSGNAGNTLAGVGDAGSDAVVGRTRAEASVSVAYARNGEPGAPATLEKSQIVRAPDGTATPVRGAVITYRLALATSGTAVLIDGEIVDLIPAGTAFVPGSIRIEDAAASDVADADPAFFDGQAIHIAIGEISQPTTRVVTFQVSIL